MPSGSPSLITTICSPSLSIEMKQIGTSISVVASRVSLSSA
jgi:hypothetical protein